MNSGASFTPHIWQSNQYVAAYRNQWNTCKCTSNPSMASNTHRKRQLLFFSVTRPLEQTVMRGLVVFPWQVVYFGHCLKKKKKKITKITKHERRQSQNKRYTHTQKAAALLNFESQHEYEIKNTFVGWRISAAKKPHKGELRNATAYRICSLVKKHPFHNI